MRPSRDEVLMEIAQAQAKRGTCERLQVGAVIHREGRILTTGYNGAPAGLPHCGHAWWKVPTAAELREADEFVPLWVQHYVAHMGKDLRPPTAGSYFYKEGDRVIHKSGPDAQIAPGCDTAAHAERNAIDWAARHGIRLDGAFLVTTDTPCWQCAGSIINAGLVGVVALRPYRDTRGRLMLEEAGLEVSLFGEDDD